MPKKQIIRRLILAVLGFLIILLERIIAELSPKGGEIGILIFQNLSEVLSIPTDNNTIWYFASTRKPTLTHPTA